MVCWWLCKYNISDSTVCHYRTALQDCTLPHKLWWSTLMLSSHQSESSCNLTERARRGSPRWILIKLSSVQEVILLHWQQLSFNSHWYCVLSAPAKKKQTNPPSNPLPKKKKKQNVCGLLKGKCLKGVRRFLFKCTMIFWTFVCKSYKRSAVGKTFTTEILLICSKHWEALMGTYRQNHRFT